MGGKGKGGGGRGGDKKVGRTFGALECGIPRSARESRASGGGTVVRSAHAFSEVGAGVGGVSAVVVAAVVAAVVLWVVVVVLWVVVPVVVVLWVVVPQEGKQGRTN